jgi:hypothetical protein
METATTGQAAIGHEELRTTKNGLCAHAAQAEATSILRGAGIGRQPGGAPANGQQKLMPLR